MERKEDSRLHAELLSIGEMFRQYGGERVALDVAREGGGKAELVRRLGEVVRRQGGVRSWDKAAGVDMSDRTAQEFSLCRLIAAEMTAAAAFRKDEPNRFDRNREFEREALMRERHAKVSEQIIGGCRGQYAEGVPIPWTVLTRDFNIGTASEAGNLMSPAVKDMRLTPDAARNALVLQQLGVMMPGGFSADFSVPLLTADQSNVGFVSEIGAATEGQPGSGLVTFSPRRVTTFVEVSRQAIIQGGPVHDMLIQRTLFWKAMELIESAVLNGDGTGNTPTGVRFAAGITNVPGGINGAQLNWGHLLDLEAGPATALAPESEFTGYVVNSKTRRWLKATQPGTLTKGTSVGACSSVVYSADWQMLMVPIFGLPGLVVDPFTKASTAHVRLVLNIYMSAGLLRPSAFAKMDDALTA